MPESAAFKIMADYPDAILHCINIQDSKKAKTGHDDNVRSRHKKEESCIHNAGDKMFLIVGRKQLLVPVLVFIFSALLITAVNHLAVFFLMR